ncbi:hypothetical protein BOSEA31B_12112 [Hyphomicrobiales bacterium]|nr:hypothetical protein BOSEA31B_12112 [Hyphomicrobiales bacterium]CAH1697892.1 hypothetical protein BOSEA1005_10937 [Hyphomicrobiales bacterium]CAI0347538.1 hypothetical protein BO1005MUT1_70319 [Hyphomicrobiales bacterium]
MVAINVWKYQQHRPGTPDDYVMRDEILVEPGGIEPPTS